MDPDAIPQFNRGVWCRFGQDDLFIRLVDQKGRNFILNKEGAQMWDMMDGTATITQIAGEMNQKFGTPITDTMALLGKLIEHRFVEISRETTWLAESL